VQIISQICIRYRGRISGEANEAVAVQQFIIVLLNSLLITLEPYIVSSEANHMFVKIRQKFCANEPKGAPH